MKKKWILTITIMLLLLIYGCVETTEENYLTRNNAALILGQEIGFSDYDVNISDVDENDPSDMIVLAVLSRNIFGPVGDRYQFRGSESFKRYDLARVSLGYYAYLKNVDDYTLEPGSQEEINDISHLDPMQRWNVYAAIHHGFLDYENNKFNPEQPVTKDELINVINKVNEISNEDPKSLNEYKKNKLEQFNMVPDIEVPINSFIDVYIPSGNQGERLMATSLQGIINRDRVSIYIDTLNDRFMLEYANRQGYFSGINQTYTSAYELLVSYVATHQLSKFVVYETSKPYQINLATDIAGVESRIIIDDSMVNRIIEIVDNPDLLYISSLGINSFHDAQVYAYENYSPFMRRDILGWSWYGMQQDFVRDYNIQLKYPTLWIPGSSSEDYDSKTQTMVSNILQSYPANIPLIGFQYAHASIDGIGMNMGIGEFTGVNLAGEYGKYTAVFDSVGNLSFYTNLPVPENKLKQPEFEKLPIEYQPDKKYIAVTMTESGDSPAYIQYGLRQRQWSDDIRGSIPYNYSYGLINMELLPLHTSYFFETMTPKDEFFGAISGLGYSYPIISFGSKGVKNEDGIYMLRADIMRDHYQKVNIVLERINFKALSLYSYPGDLWGEYDYIEMDEHLFSYITYANTIVADMHRPQNFTNLNPVKESNHGHVIFHCVTFWSLSDLGSSTDQSKDHIAIQYLVEEIISNTQDNGQFFHAMAYSWHFGPRRIQLAMNEIERLYPGEYIFVNISELNYLYQKRLIR